MTLRAYKYRLYPNQEQSQYIDRNFGAVRFVWNQFVASFNSFGLGPTIPQEEKVIKDVPGNEWLYDCISYTLQQKRIDWDQYEKQFFNKGRKKKLGRPNFKKKGIANDSFRIPFASLPVKAIDLDNGTIKLPKMKTPIKMVVDRPFTGQVRSVTVSKNKCDQYFVSILVEERVIVKPLTGNKVGIDLGLTHLAILSDGTKIDNPRWFRETQSELKKAQQHLSRKTKGSNRYSNQRLQVAKIHLKISNQRKHLQHNLSSKLVNNYDVIVVEDLSVQNMVKNRKLAKSIVDASWSTLVDMINYKCGWYGKIFLKIDRFFASSKLCSNCGHKNNGLKLSIRDWICPDCGTNHDRDINAAKNILAKGLSLL
jgi:putative transposase